MSLSQETKNALTGSITSPAAVNEIINALNASNSGGSVAVTAAGSVQGDAASLTASALNVVASADGTKGVILPTAVANVGLTVYNNSASNLKVYPPSGGNINGGSNNASVTVAARTYAVFTGISTTTYASNYTAGGTNATLTGSETLTNKTLTAPTINSPVVTEAQGASTAAAGTTNADAGALPAGTGRVYPTTGADDTKGVIVSTSDKVTGRMLFIGNGVSNKILKVYGPSGATINGAAANAAFSSASGKGVIMFCIDSTANTWFAW